MGRAKKTIQEKVQKAYPTFTEEVDRLPVADLEKRLSNYAKAINENDQAQDEDEKLEQAKEEVKELTGVYSGPRKELKLKSRYMSALIKEKGGM